MAQNGVPPPLYNNDHVQASAEMRAGFARLVQDQKDIIGLFEKIATELKTQQQNSRMQPLIDEWGVLRKVSVVGLLLVLEVNGRLIFVHFLDRDIRMPTINLATMPHGVHNSSRVS